MRNSSVGVYFRVFFLSYLAFKNIGSMISLWSGIWCKIHSLPSPFPCILPTRHDPHPSFYIHLYCDLDKFSTSKKIMFSRLSWKKKYKYYGQTVMLNHALAFFVSGKFFSKFQDLYIYILCRGFLSPLQALAFIPVRTYFLTFDYMLKLLAFYSLDTHS